MSESKLTFVGKIAAIERAMSLDPEYFTDWEMKFLRSVKNQAMPLSESQDNYFDLLWEKTRKR